MLRQAYFAGLLMTLGLAVAGCELYLEDSDGRSRRGGDSGDYGYCDETGCYECDDYGCYSVGDPGSECDDHYDCPAGCYCTDEGVCAEGGFCREHSDCELGFECDDRNSCVPKGTNGGGGGSGGSDPEICEDHGDCPLGSYCDEETGECADSDTCRSRECGPGYRCDERDTCVPDTCTDHDQCVEGSYCERDSGTCIPTERCEEGECAAEGFECDFTRDTCVPEDEFPGSCDGDIDCDVEPPTCDDDEAPLIRDGCYTGECIAVDRCDVPPRLACDNVEDEDTCLDADHCRAVYAGYDCTTQDGAACQPGDSGCFCERFEFDRCEAR